MPRKPLTPQKLAALARRQEIGRRYLRGETQAAIATALGCSQGRVSRHLARLRTEWRDAAAGSMAAKLERELARVDQLEREAWAAWQQAADALAQATHDAPDKPTTAKRLPPSKALETVRWCIEQRCKLFGLYAPQKIAATNLEGTAPAWSPEQMEQFARSLTDEELATLRGLRNKMPRSQAITLPPEGIEHET